MYQLDVQFCKAYIVEQSSNIINVPRCKDLKQSFDFDMCHVQACSV